MQTNFTLAQLADPNIAEADRILRTCVHCGFCTATCPTYVLLGDELDSPRGPHLPDQGHAGARPAGHRRRGQAYRPLPLVPGLHDDLSLGRALHASGRSCPRPYRNRPMRRPLIDRVTPRDPRPRAAGQQPAALGARRGAAGQAVRGSVRCVRAWVCRGHVAIGARPAARRRRRVTGGGCCPSRGSVADGWRC